MYSEVMGYTLAMFNELIENFNVEITVIYWDKNKLTPFEFDCKEAVLIPRSKMNMKSAIALIDDIKPNILYVSGWMDSLYVATAKYAKSKKHIVVAGLDTPWEASIKQYFSSFILRLYWKKRFTYFWVPGKRQRKYARNLGYSDRNIIDNLYSANVAQFQSSWIASESSKRKAYPHRILFVGRLAPEKGVLELINSFIKLKNAHPNDWVLSIAGSGSIEMNLPKHESVEYLGFLSAEEIIKEMNRSGVFCLPSTREPWGVVIHEAASAGLPLLLSRACGAAEIFLNDNGVLFSMDSKNELFDSLKYVIGTSDKELLGWAERSFELSNIITPKSVAESLISTYDTRN